MCYAAGIAGWLEFRVCIYGDNQKSVNTSGILLPMCMVLLEKMTIATCVKSCPFDSAGNPWENPCILWFQVYWVSNSQTAMLKII